MATADGKPPNFFPPLEQILWGAVICGPAFVATRVEVASRLLHTFFLCCHAIAFAVIVWVVFVSPRVGPDPDGQPQFPGFFRRAAGVSLIVILISASASWYLINHWSPDSNGAIFATTAISCGVVIAEFWIWWSYRIYFVLPRKIETLIAEGSLQEALDLLLPRLNGATPTSTDHLTAANLYWKLNQRTKAQSIFDEVLVRSNRAPIVLNNVASSYRSLERHLEALALIDEALQKSDAPMVELLINRCLSLIALGRRDEARDQFRLLEQLPDLSMKDAPTIQSALATIRSSITTE